MDSDGQWCLIESDPGVFTDLIRNFGVSGVQVEELYSLDDDACSNLKPIFGLIFLYKWRPGDEPMGKPTFDADHIYFAQQIITNACATQAIVNLLLNVDSPHVELGTVLSEFKSFSKEFTAENRGLALGNSEQIRAVHNSYGRTQMYEVLQPQSKDDDVFHFVAYVPIKGKVYELDGLRDAPLEVASVAENQDWMDVARPVINQRIAKYSQGEIHFNLMALVRDRRSKIREQLALLGDSKEHEAEVAQLHADLTAEDEKEIAWKLENRRRRHNYIPFIVELLKVLAKEDMLVPLVKEAIEKKKLEEGEKAAKKASA